MYRHCLLRQVNEIELLKSFFCNEGELHIVNEEQYDKIKETLDNSKALLADRNTDELPSFSMNLELPFYYRKECSITMNVTFPPFYPSTECVEVNFYGTSRTFTREQEQQLRQDISHLAQTKLGQECVLDLVQFTKEWLENTFSSSIAQSSPPSSISPSSSPGREFDDHRAEKNKAYEIRRILFWFATIAPDRAKALSDWAKQLGLTGLYKLGTPALLVVEGPKGDVDEFISSIRSFRWKKIDILWEECCRVPDVNSARKFHQFNECMLSIPDLQPIFKEAGLEEVFKEGLKIRGYFTSNLKVF